MDKDTPTHIVHLWHIFGSTLGTNKNHDLEMGAFCQGVADHVTSTKKKSVKMPRAHKWALL